MSDCIFEIHQLWQSGFSRVYSNSFCSCSFEPEIIKISHSSHKMYSNIIRNYQESTTNLNACAKKNLETYWMHHVYLHLSLSFSSITYFYVLSLFLFLIINFLLFWTFEKLVILMKSFWNKDGISFLNPLPVFRFINLSTFIFSPLVGFIKSTISPCYRNG